MEVDFLVSKIFEGSDSLGQVVVEAGHAGRKEGVDDRAGQEAPQVCLEETQNEGFVGLPEKNKQKK